MTQVNGRNQMSKKKRRRHSAKFKAKVALEAVKEIKNASEIGADYEAIQPRSATGKGNCWATWIPLSKREVKVRIRRTSPRNATSREPRLAS